MKASYHTIIKIILYCKSAIWLFLSILYCVRQVSPNPTATFKTIAFLLFINALIYFLLGLFWKKSNKLIFWLTILFVLANLFLTITDNIGIIDIASLITDLAILILILNTYNDYAKYSAGNYIGAIIEESISNKSVLKDVQITKTEIEKVTAKHETPHLKKWTLHTVEIRHKDGKKIAKKLSQVLIGDKATCYWYADYKNNQEAFIIFPNKIFKIQKGDKNGFLKARQYGISLNIPKHQVNFKSDW